jgi:D-alanine-D-alanine ligase-like ATP-grasp enzyme
MKHWNRLAFAFSFWAIAASPLCFGVAEYQFAPAVNCPQQVLIAREAILRSGTTAVGMLDAASSGEYLPAAFQSLGLEVKMLHSVPASEQPSWYGKLAAPDFVHQGDLQATVSELRSMRVGIIAHGTDKAFKLASELSHELGAPNVDASMSDIIRDKYRQNRFLAKLGIPVPDTFATDQLQQMLDWQIKHGKFPVVVKPLDSSGSDGLHICENIDQVVKAFQKLYLKRNVDGNINHMLIIQEFMEGPEFVVNFASSAGVHLLTDVWEYHKKEVTVVGGAKAHIRSHNDLIALSQANEEMVRYCIRILNAFKYWFGASHFEVMLTANGPRLVELNPRLAGARLPQYVAEAGGWPPALIAAEGLARPGLFRQRLTQVAPVYQPGRLVRLISTQAGKIAYVKNLDTVKSLLSYKSHDFKGVGAEIEFTQNVMTCPGKIFLSHLNPQQIEDDMEIIRSLDFFVLE